jgi:hypothetical protein
MLTAKEVAGSSLAVLMFSLHVVKKQILPVKVKTDKK